MRPMGKRRRLPLRQPGTGGDGAGFRRDRDSTGPCGRPKEPKTMNYHVESGPNFGERSNASSERFDTNDNTTSGKVNA